MEDQQTFPSSFGELLKTHRKRKRLTQKQLAQQLGVHANTISSWELGTYLPDTRGLVLELARHLALDEQETRQLLEASLTALSPHWLVPLSRNPFFTGREEILEPSSGSKQKPPNMSCRACCASPSCYSCPSDKKRISSALWRRCSAG